MPPAAPIVIVGGGPAGLSAARGFREAGGTARVVLLCAESLPPYRRPPLTKEFLRGGATVQELIIERPAWFARHGIELRTGTSAAVLDPEPRVVVTGAGEEIVYGACVLCTGSEPRRLPIPGADSPRVHVVRTIRDSAALAAAVGSGTRVMVVGGGFIGCEAAVSLAMRGATVALVTPEDSPQEARLGPEVGGRLAAWLREAGVALTTGRSLEAIAPAGEALRLTLDDRTTRDCDRVLMATGVRPRVGLAREAGIPLDGDAVLTDSAMRTEVDGVWCAGDPALAMNPSAGRRLRVEHWGEALRQGTVAGRSLAGHNEEWSDVPGFWSTIGHRTLKQAAWGDGWDTVEVETHGAGFTAWYGRRGSLAGVLTHERDHDYESGATRIRRGDAWPFGA